MYIAGICKIQDTLPFAAENHADPRRNIDQIQCFKMGQRSWTEVAWHESYGAFSVSSPNVSKIIQYIDNQEARHGKPQRRFIIDSGYLPSSVICVGIFSILLRAHQRSSFMAPAKL